MHRRPAREGDCPITRFQLLWHDIDVVTASEAVEATLAYLSQDAVHPFAATQRLRFEIETDARGYIVHERGDVVARVALVLDVLDVIYARSHQWAFELASLCGWVRLHGALVDIGAERVLLTGAAGSGKTTLAVRLLFDGADVHGDESLLARGGMSIAVPRRFHVKPWSLPHVPELAPLWNILPRWDGDPPLRALAPTDAGARWELTVRPVNRVVLLSPDPQCEPSRLEPIDTGEAIRCLLDEAFPLLEDHDVLVREVAQLVASARCERLLMADPGSASRVLRHFPVYTPAAV